VNESCLFDVEMQWGAQPVRLTAARCRVLPTDAPTTSVHIVAFHGGRVLVVCDRKGVFGFPGGRLEAAETREQAMAREVYEEASANLNPDYRLFAALKIQCTVRLPGRNYPHPHTYMGMYVGTVRSLDPIRRDPAGIVTSRALFTRADCEKNLQLHDRILLREALNVIAERPDGGRILRTFLGCELGDFPAALLRLEEP
jgi:8-oxo-dGTP pyrophosphatase MutT (NUDIX family)